MLHQWDAALVLEVLLVQMSEALEVCGSHLCLWGGLVVVDAELLGAYAAKG